MRVKTFRNRRLSLLQSALAEHLYSTGEASRSAWDAAGHEKMQAVAAVGKGFEELTPEEPLPTEKELFKGAGPGSPAEGCAHAVIDLLFGGFRERIRAVAVLSPFGNCDAGWLKVIASYYEYVWFGGKIPYVAAESASDSALDTLPERCQIGILGDWGTGTPTAQEVLQQLQKCRQSESDVPFVLLHLGDVYYSGTGLEFSQFKQGIRQCFATEPVFTLAGNHDMYSGGSAYYQCVRDLNDGTANAINTSFFCLRIRFCQFLAMDSGLHVRDPFEVSSSLTYLEPSEIKWHRQQLESAGNRKVVLLSHHQPFSAFSAVGKDQNNNEVYVNRGLLNAFNGKGLDPAGEDFLPNVAAWFFGHEHNTIFYQPFEGVKRARCMGSSAIPADTAECDPYKIVDPRIPWMDKKLGITNGLYHHGYATIDLDGPSAHARYYQYPAKDGIELMYEEKLEDS